VDTVFAGPGAEVLSLTLSDDDGGSDDAEAGVIVTGNATKTQGQGWWKKQYSGNGKPDITPATAAAYLEIANAVSSVFSEQVTCLTPADVQAVLTPDPNDWRGKATAQLLLAWLDFASGSVSWDATVPVGGNETVDFLDLMFEAESTILNPAATGNQLKDVEQKLAKVRQASSS
jgi:hypothetical protein